MSKIAVIGLGVMGLPMAINLAAAGHTVVGQTRTPSRGKDLEAHGGHLVGALREAVQDADVIITMLPDTPDVEQVAGGEDGIFAHAPSGAVWIDCSTIAPSAAQDLAARAREHGLRPIDAPVSGGEAGAINGTLSIMAGGDAADLAAAEPVFSAISSSVVHAGASGAGQIVKSANQIITGGTMALVAEALVYLEANGVNPEAAFAAMSGGLAGSRILEVKGPQMRTRDFTPGFRIDLHHKDLGIALETARSVGVYVPLTAAAATLMAAARARGQGNQDHTGIVATVEAMSGRGEDERPIV